MLKICRNKWAKNRAKLKKALAEDTGLNNCDYLYLVQKTIKYILNDEEDYWDIEHITTVDNGDYQGTLLFIIPRKTYQPSAYEYLITTVDYGSCSGCDTLLGIQDLFSDKLSTENQLKDYMALCKDLICNIKRPYFNKYDVKDEWVEVDFKEVI